jgi:hypothetical protein
VGAFASVRVGARRAKSSQLFALAPRKRGEGQGEGPGLYLIDGASFLAWALSQTFVEALTLTK